MTDDRAGDTTADKAPPLDASASRSGGDALSADEAIAAAEASVAEVVAQQADWADQELADMIEACSIVAKKPETKIAQFETVYARSHDLKGLGTSFGYALVTQVGGLLCDYLRDNPDGDNEIVELHVRSLKLILDDHMEGDAGEDGRKLVEGLRKVVEMNCSGR